MQRIDYEGQILDNRYRVEKLLGEGGMGAVYGGSHLIIGRQVAIKFLHAEFTGKKEVIKRFYREADRVRLEPANARYAPIYTDDCQIEAVVVGLLRQM